MLPPISVPWSSELLIIISHTGSPPAVRSLRSVISAPISSITSIIPVLVGLIPTLRMVISESGIIAPRTMKNAAEEMSPGTVIS